MSIHVGSNRRLPHSVRSSNLPRCVRGEISMHLLQVNLRTRAMMLVHWASGEISVTLQKLISSLAMVVLTAKSDNAWFCWKSRASSLVKVFSTPMSIRLGQWLISKEIMVLLDDCKALMLVPLNRVMTRDSRNWHAFRGPRSVTSQIEDRLRWRSCLMAITLSWNLLHLKQANNK